MSRGTREAPAWKRKLDLGACQVAVERMRDRSGSVALHFHRGEFTRAEFRYLEDADHLREEMKRAG